MSSHLLRWGRPEPRAAQYPQADRANTTGFDVTPAGRTCDIAPNVAASVGDDGTAVDRVLTLLAS
jgi:hypothetical protein